MSDQHPAEPAESGDTSNRSAAFFDAHAQRLAEISAEPLAGRAASFEQLHDELLAELQRGEHDDAN